MKQVRKGLFETNSSSTHSLVVCSNNEFDKVLNGELLIGNDELYTILEVFERINNCEDNLLNKEIINNAKTFYNDNRELLNDYGYYSYNDYLNDEYLDSFQENHTINNTDIVVFGKYGYNG